VAFQITERQDKMKSIDILENVLQLITYIRP